MHKTVIIVVAFLSNIVQTFDERIVLRITFAPGSIFALFYNAHSCNSNSPCEIEAVHLVG